VRRGGEGDEGRRRGKEDERKERRERRGVKGDEGRRRGDAGRG